MALITGAQRLDEWGLRHYDEGAWRAATDGRGEITVVCRDAFFRAVEMIFASATCPATRHYHIANGVACVPACLLKCVRVDCRSLPDRLARHRHNCQ